MVAFNLISGSEYAYPVDSLGVSRVTVFECHPSKNSFYVIGERDSHSTNILINFHGINFRRAGERVHSWIEIDKDIVTARSSTSHREDIIQICLIRRHDVVKEDKEIVLVNSSGPTVKINFKNIELNTTMEGTFFIKINEVEKSDTFTVSVIEESSAPIIQPIKGLYSFFDPLLKINVDCMLDIEGPVTDTHLYVQGESNSYKYNDKVNFYKRKTFFKDIYPAVLEGSVGTYDHPIESISVNEKGWMIMKKTDESYFVFNGFQKEKVTQIASPERIVEVSSIVRDYNTTRLTTFSLTR